MKKVNMYVDRIAEEIYTRIYVKILFIYAKKKRPKCTIGPQAQAGA